LCINHLHHSSRTISFVSNQIYNNMKKRFLLFAISLIATSLSTKAQNNVGVNTTTPHPSAALDVQSTTQGMLIPRMTAAQRDSISLPAAGLLVYQSDAPSGFYFHNGIAWSMLGAAGAQGPKGDSGVAGAQGIQGVQGIKGDSGVAGPQGAQGIQGIKGDSGVAGPQGIQGIQGIKGDSGVAGPQGIQGIQGIKGDSGVAGPQGIQGLQGVKGDSGVAGPQGVQGVQGVKGDSGVAGPQGMQGIQGIQGIPGSAASVGYNFMTKTANYTITSADMATNLVLINTTANTDLTFTMPLASSVAAGTSAFISGSSTANFQSVNVISSGSDSFIGIYTPAGTTNLSTALGAFATWAQIVSDGANKWYIIGLYF
jgi:Collagen triple helix repeat (20 copies)